MFEVDYDPKNGEILIKGESAGALFHTSVGTNLSVILEFHQKGKNILISDDGNHAGSKIADTVKALDKSGIPNYLSISAKHSLEEHIQYLKDFRSSSISGRSIHQEPPEKIGLPNSFLRELRPFQTLSVSHLTSLKNSANFSVPGSGKTTMVLAAYSLLKERGEVSKIIVICPRSAFGPWKDEYTECFGREPDVLRIAGQPKERKLAMAEASSFELILCTYQMLVNESESVGKIMKENPSLLILDESHHIKKGPGGAWYDAVANIAPLAKRRYILSGTPAPNSLNDLIPQFEILWPGLNPALNAMDIYNISDEVANFRDALRPFYSRVTKNSLGLPERNLIKIPVHLGEVQQRIYDILCHRILPHTLEKIEDRNLVRDLRKALVVRLLQAASNPSLLGEFSKEFRLPPLSAFGVDLENLINNYSSYEVPEKFLVGAKLAKKLSEEGRKSIIWTSFVHNANTLHKLLSDSGIQSILITGGLSLDDEGFEQNRENLLSQFKVDPSQKVLIATIPSIAESISLHKVCHDAIYIDRTFNCGLYMQSLDRIHRVGLPKGTNVRYHMLLGTGTLDEVIDSRLEYKMGIMHQVLNDDIGILNLDIPDDLSDGDWDDEDIAAVLDHIYHNCSN